MMMTGIYRIALVPGANEQAFIDHMLNHVFKSTSVLQLTRITIGFSHQLLKAGGPFHQYAWLTAVDLVTASGYDFEENAGRVQKAIEKFGVLTGIDTYTNLALPAATS